MTTASERIASFAAGFDRYPLTDAQRHIAYRAFLDTFSVAVAGRNEEATHIARQYLDDVNEKGTATIWITGETMPAEAAALLNGTAGHVLDYDDVMQPMRGHPSVAMIPALAALAQVTGADGRKFSTAYIAGFEVLAKISKVMANKHASRGWHPTASLGILGAVVGCGVMLGLSEKQMRDAIGLGVTFAGGTRQNFGTMAKALQVGQAGASAIRAARLAQAGYDAPFDALDGKFGFMTLFGHNEDLSAALEGLGQGTLELDSVGLDVKKYPCCYAIHRTLDGIFDLRKEHTLTLDAIEHVEIVTNFKGLEPLPYSDPRTELEAKFSMQYPVAAALYDGRMRLATFTDEAVNRPVIRAFLPQVSTREADGPLLPRWAEITMRLKNGKTLNQRVTSSRGDAQWPLSDDELVEKAEDCFSYGGVPWAARSFAQSVLGLSSSSVAKILSSLSLTPLGARPAHHGQ